MFRRSHQAFLLFCLFAFGAMANATTLWNWSVTFDGGSGTGTFTTDDSPAANTVLTIVGITGVFDGSTITGVSNYNYADQLFEWDGTSNSPLYVNPCCGISFSLASAGDVNLTIDGPNEYLPITYFVQGGAKTSITSSSVSLATPEPSGIFLLSCGMIMLGMKTGLGYRRRQVRIARE